LTEDRAFLTVWETEVEAVQSTVVWPDCWLCTSMVVPEMAATDPEAPGAPPGEAAPAIAVEPRQAASEMHAIAPRVTGR
jgi:hypothetical protein